MSCRSPSLIPNWEGLAASGACWVLLRSENHPKNLIPKSLCAPKSEKPIQELDLLGFNSSKSSRERRSEAQTLLIGIVVIWRSLLPNFFRSCSGMENGVSQTPNPKAQNLGASP